MQSSATVTTSVEVLADAEQLEGSIMVSHTANLGRITQKFCHALAGADMSTHSGPLTATAGDTHNIQMIGRGAMRPETTQLNETPLNDAGRLPRPGKRLFVSLLATLMLAATLAGGLSAAGAESEECFGSASTLNAAKADFANRCTEPRVDCDQLDSTWYCSDHVIGDAAPNGNDGPSSTIVPGEDPEPAPDPDPEPTVCTATAATLAQARAAYADTCDVPRVDCDPVDAGWTCSSGVIGASAPNAPTTTEPPTTEPPTTEPPTTEPPTTEPPTTEPPTTEPPTTEPPTTEPPSTCSANTSGSADLDADLISLQYDHAPDRDDGHATAAGKQVATVIGFTPWVVGGAYGADNANTYNDASEVVMDAVWGANNWVNADANWTSAVQVTADRWETTLDACGDIWIAEGGQSDFSADVVRELQDRQPSLATTERIHLVQHSDWNEQHALDADLAFVQAETDYIRIPDGNSGGNGTADFNDENYDGPFIDAALSSSNAAGFAAAFDYYSPQNARLDFSDTVELMEILDIGTNQVNDIADFADVFFDSSPVDEPVDEPVVDDPLEGLHPDIVAVIDVAGRNPGGVGWADSYSVGDACYCATTFDHNIGGITVDTPDGPKTVREVCDTLGEGPGIADRPIYNDVQCGNGPANDAGDEDDCPGRVDIGLEGCGQIGPKWDLSVFEQ